MTVKRNNLLSIALTTTLGLVASACVDNTTARTPGAHSETRTQAVTAVPQFMITGTDAMPDSLFVSELALTVTEIRLEPMWSMDSLAYTTRDALKVDFDIAEGQTLQTAGELALPEPGRYLVSIRLEPADESTADNSASFSMDGFVAGQEDDDKQAVPETMDGRPQPMPFDASATDTTSAEELTDSQAYPDEWTPFQYHSRRAVFFTFNDVELSEGTQALTFTFDVRDWAIDVLEPISNAVRSSSGVDESVDATNQIEGSGNGVEALIRTGVVRSDQIPPG